MTRRSYVSDDCCGCAGIILKLNLILENVAKFSSSKNFFDYKIQYFISLLPYIICRSIHSLFFKLSFFAKFVSIQNFMFSKMKKSGNILLVAK